MQAENKKDCLNEAINEHYALWTGYARSIVRCPIRAMDCVQETLLKILENQKEKAQVLACKGELKYYVCKAVFRMAIDDSSKYGIKYRRFDQNWAADSTEFEKERDAPWLGSRLDNEYLDSYIQLMPEREAILLRLYILDGFSYDDVSDATGIPKNKLYQYIHNAINKIRSNVHRSPSNSGREANAMPSL